MKRLLADTSTGGSDESKVSFLVALIILFKQTAQETFYLHWQTNNTSPGPNEVRDEGKIEDGMETGNSGVQGILLVWWFDTIAECCVIFFSMLEQLYFVFVEEECAALVCQQHHHHNP